MFSLVLGTATRYLLPLMLLFSVFLLLRGHNEPGGGFSAGLVAAAAFALYALANGVRAARAILQLDVHTLIGSGLLISLVSGLVPWLIGWPFLTGVWSKLDTPWQAAIELGTPVFFDIGVYLVVLGVALMILFTLAEE
jgi:multicomponent Na+:H+ antiporter subunit B